MQGRDLRATPTLAFEADGLDESTGVVTRRIREDTAGTELSWLCGRTLSLEVQNPLRGYLRFVACDPQARRPHHHRSELAALEHARSVGVLKVTCVEGSDDAVSVDDLAVDQMVAYAAAERS